VLEPRPRAVLAAELVLANHPRPERSAPDFLLKDQVVDLMRLFDELVDGTIEVLEVKHGLPFRVFVADAVS